MSKLVAGLDYPSHQPHLVRIAARIDIEDPIVINIIYPDLSGGMNDLVLLPDDADMNNFPLFIVKKRQIPWQGFFYKCDIFTHH